jgi:hypothetical protein
MSQKNFEIWFPTEQKSFQEDHIFGKKSPIFCHGDSKNYKLTPAPSEIAKQFPPPLTFERGNFLMIFSALPGNSF